jgi:hypothetical protein
LGSENIAVAATWNVAASSAYYVRGNAGCSYRIASSFVRAPDAGNDRRPTVRRGITMRFPDTRADAKGVPSPLGVTPGRIREHFGKVH